MSSFLLLFDFFSLDYSQDAVVSFIFDLLVCLFVNCTQTIVSHAVYMVKVAATLLDTVYNYWSWLDQLILWCSTDISPDNSMISFWRRTSSDH